MAPTIDGKINYVFWGALGRRLQRLHELFPRNSIQIFTLDEFKESPEQLYAELLAFLGVEHDGRKVFGASNKSYRIRNPKLHFAVISAKRAFSGLEPIRKLRGGRGLGVLKLINRWNFEPGGYGSVVPDSLRLEIREVLAEDTHLAETYLDGRTLVPGPAV